MSETGTAASGHGQERDQGGAPALQEDVDHQHYKRQRFEQRVDNLLHAGRNSQRGIETDGGTKVLRKASLQLRQFFPHARRGLNSV